MLELAGKPIRGLGGMAGLEGAGVKIDRRALLQQLARETSTKLGDQEPLYSPSMCGGRSMASISRRFPLGSVSNTC